MDPSSPTDLGGSSKVGQRVYIYIYIYKVLHKDAVILSQTSCGGAMSQRRL